jgi:3-isopropylmalate dehydratase small subunit
MHQIFSSSYLGNIFQDNCIVAGILEINELKESTCTHT